MHEFLNGSMVHWPTILDGNQDKNFRLTGCVSIERNNLFVCHSNEFTSIIDKIGLQIIAH